MGLIAQGAISNPISAKMDFEENNTNCNLEIASMPYSAIADNEVKISDDDLKAKYEACKELYRLHGETRDLKLINVTVVASPKDQGNIVAQVKSPKTRSARCQLAKLLKASCAAQRATFHTTTLSCRKTFTHRAT